MGAVHVVVSGRVQGVGYRAWTEGEAADRGLRGWVRNRRDGTVEAVLSGERVDEMLLALWDGPPAATVTDVAVETYEGPLPESFEVRSTV